MIRAFHAAVLGLGVFLLSCQSQNVLLFEPGGAGGSMTPISPENNADQVTLPIEVFGVEGTIMEVSFPLPDKAIEMAKKLALRLHNVGYRSLASVQVNAAGWVPITNETIEVSEPAKMWGGIGGGFATLTVKLNLPAAALTKGRNTLRFRFDKTTGVSMGYRVIGVDFLAADGTSLVPPNLFVDEDPSKWTPPVGADAKAGATWWATAELLEGPRSTAKLRARCSDCHAEDGRDLKYFNYSNFAIVERAKFYGLSEQQGKDIAAYIRGNNAPAPGRPWNPPFQPGLGNTNRALESFSAGAGIEALVDEDTTIATIFKSGFDRSALAEGNALRRINLSDIPIALQLPDWNHWLPEVHPKDSVAAAFDTSRANNMLSRLREHLASLPSTALKQYWSNLGFDVFLGSNAGAQSDFLGVADAMSELRTMVPGYAGDGRPPEMFTDVVTKQVYAIGVWSHVKTWELMNRFGLEAYALDAYPGVGEKRAWFLRRHLADTPSFLQAATSTGSSDWNRDYLSNSWHHLQLALNAGQRACGGHACLDYGASFGALSVVASKYNLYEGGRRLLWAIKTMEEHDNGKGPKLYEGFSLATANPFRALGLHEMVARRWWKDPAHSERGKALAVTAQVFAEKLGTWSAEYWRDENYGKGEDGANFMDASRVVGEGGAETSARSIGDGMWHDLPVLSELGVHPAVVNALARFGLAMWPRNDWMSQGKPLTGTAPPAPTLSVSNGSVKIEWSQAAPSHNVYRATSPDGPWMPVALLRQDPFITDAPVEKDKTYHYAVSANTASSESPLSPSRPGPRQ